MKKPLLAVAARANLRLVFLAMCAFFAGGAHAEPEMIIVPYDKKQPVAGQQPNNLYLPYERFLELWQQAKAHRTDMKAAPADQPWVLSAARYDGQLGERTLAFRGTLDLLTTNDAWTEVPLAFDGAQVSGLQVDGQPAAFDGTKVLINQPGRHRLEVTFELSRAAAQTEWKWRIPRTAGTLVSLTLPDPRLSATIQPGSGTIERTENGAKIVTAALGATEEVRVAIESSGTIERIAAPAAASITSEVRVSPGLETTRAETVFTFPKARQDRFIVFFENGLTLTGIEADNVKSWRLTPGDARQELQVTLHEPASETFTIAVTCDRALPALPADLRAPAFSAAASRLENRVALFADERLAVTPDAAARQIGWEKKELSGFRLVAAFSGATTPGYHAEFAETRREARIDYVYQVNRRKIELIASLSLEAKGGTMFGVTLGLPTEFEVQAVESARLQDWWRAGDELHVRFQGATPEKTPLVVYLVRQYPAAPTDLEVRPLTLAGFKKVSGEAVIAAHKNVEAAMQLSATARELAPEKAATDFEILPPLERKRGFSFKEESFSAQVRLSALPAKFNALWVLHAQAHEGWLALSMRARLTLRQGSVDRATFTLPAELPEARVTGDEVRETRSRIDGARRIYEVQLQNDAHEQVELTIDLELPHAGDVALPAITFPEAQVVSGYVLADNASEYEMRVQSSGGDPAVKNEIPWLPALSQSASIFRVQPDWAITLSLARLEKVSGRAAFCAWAELTTALRRDGTAWHKAVWRLQNRSLQFLPVRLPEGAELMSARVAGQSVRADAGSIDGKPAVLIPLIKTKPGELSYDVEVVWRARGAELGWRAGRKFDDPEVPGITVERTFWNVWLPDDRKLSDFDGNMEAVVEEVQKAEKLEDAVQEMKSLVSLVSAPSKSADVRYRALKNAKQLQQQIEVETASEGTFWDHGISAHRSENFKGKALKDQQEYAGRKNREVVQELQQQVRQLDEAAKQEVPAPSVDAPQITDAGSSINYSLAIQGTNSAGQTVARWDENKLYTGPARQSGKTAPTSESNANLVINDSVVLQRAAEPAPPATPAPDDAKKRSDFAKALPEKPQSKDTPAPAAEPAQQQAPAALNTARGNAYVEQRAAPGTPMRGAQPVGADGPPPSSMSGRMGGVARVTPPVTTSPAAPLAQPAPSDAAPIDSLATMSPGISAEAMIAAPRKEEPELQERLQPEGRISLAVEFPTEGRVYHFKKVKAHANLELTTTAPEAWKRWGWLALGLTLAAALGLAQHRFDRRATA